MESKRSISFIYTGLLAVLGITLAFIVSYPPGYARIGEHILQSPFPSDSGFSYIASLPGIPLPGDDVSPSSVNLFEDGKALGPMNSLHEEIRRKGNGGFSHWAGQLYFSTSNNSDPNVNGRNYSIRYPLFFPPWLYISLIMLNYLIVLGIVDKIIRYIAKEKRWLHGTLRGMALLVISCCLVQIVFWVMIKDALAKSDSHINRWYEYSFMDKINEFMPGESINYSEHHYLNYALNPSMKYGSTHQFNKKYKVRRTEPIRPRHQVKLRILALGGSTTFGEKVKREEDTWVYQLEQHVRGVCGNTCEVINGGVGGYTVAENLIHYSILLSQLEPDIVLLYEGINDVDARLFGVLQSDYSNYRIPWRSAGAVIAPAKQEFSWFYPYQYYFLKTKIAPLQKIGIGGVVSPPHPPPSAWKAALERNDSTVYAMHMRNLIRLISGQGHTVVVLPQYFTVLNKSDEIYVKGVREHNEVNRALAHEMELPFLEHLANPSTFVSGDTYDNCHFNEHGSKKMAEVVWKFLKQHQLI